MSGIALVSSQSYPFGLNVANAVKRSFHILCKQKERQI